MDDYENRFTLSGLPDNILIPAPKEQDFISGKIEKNEDGPHEGSLILNIDLDRSNNSATTSIRVLSLVAHPILQATRQN